MLETVRSKCLFFLVSVRIVQQSGMFGIDSGNPKIIRKFVRLYIDFFMNM